MFSFLYRLIIMPLYLFFEFVFVKGYKLTGNYGLTIILLSLVVNVLILPLYRRADEVQRAQREKEKSLEKWAGHIRRTFRGDERTMLLATYYRQNQYRQTDSLKSMTSLLLQIPFFIAAYRFLSGLQQLQGVSFGPIPDLGAPDGMLKVAGLTINLLPILMTLINILSGVFYLKDLPLKSKIQTYGIAVVFLVLLYFSPAGLVFYWTLNNVFSLVKNILTRTKDPKKHVSVLLAIAGIALLIYGGVLHRPATTLRTLFVLMVSAALLVPALLRVLEKRRMSAGAGRDQAAGQTVGKTAGQATDRTVGKAARQTAEMAAGQKADQAAEMAAGQADEQTVKQAVEQAVQQASGKGTISVSREVIEKKTYRRLYISGILYLTLLIGVLIPSAVVSSSPAEFIDQTNYMHPLTYVLRNLNITAGVFLVWVSVFYGLATETGKKIIRLLLWIGAGLASVNYLFFGKNLGIMSGQLIFDIMPAYSRPQKVINLAVLLAAGVLLYVIAKRFPGLMKALYPALLVGVLVLAGRNVLTTNRKLSGMTNYLLKRETAEPVIPLSRTGTNVIVLMLDRYIGAYVPFLFNEVPEMEEWFDGFTFYPNTVTVGTSTNTGSPALYGGYEYTPYAMNMRADESLEEKHNEALKVMPVLFAQNGYTSSTFDPPYAGYKWISDLSVFDGYDNVYAYQTIGRFDPELKAHNRKIVEHNFFCYSIFKVLPLCLQQLVYNQGDYNSTDMEDPDYTDSFMDNYSVLTNLVNMTQVEENGDTFMIMDNRTTHEPSLLQTPGYEPVMHLDRAAIEAFEAEHADRFTVNGVTMRNPSINWLEHYYTYMAVMKQLKIWFDYMRENGVYDNTRIIIVSDHGYGFGQFKNMYLENGFDTEWFNPVLMVKDFDSHGFTTDNTFMTNADTPSLAVADVIEEAVNPFTGNEISNEEKNKDPFYVFHTTKWGVDENNGNTFVEDPSNCWFTVHDDIFNHDNWTEVEDPFS